MKPNKGQIEELLGRGVEEVIERDHLERALLSGKRLRVKLGIDPTAADLHLGHSVVLRKLRQFQKLGHRVVFIIGDFTGRVGDPAGRAEARKTLTPAQVKKNIRGYLAQAGKILNVKKTEIHHNSEWFEKEGIEKLIALLQASTIRQILGRADFQKRLEADNDISLLEILYPLFQGYDSVKVKADVELGGADQKLNLLMGRKVQRHFGMPEQDVMTMPLLEGLDGERKMSKSYGNYIGLSDPPDDMFGKIMSLPDSLTEKYFRLCTDVPENEILKLSKGHPKKFKERLAFEIVKLYHGEKRAKSAGEGFKKFFSRGEALANLYAAGTSIPVVEFVRKHFKPSDKTISGSEAWRLVKQGAFELNKKAIKDPKKMLTLCAGDVVQIGKKYRVSIK